MNKTPKRKGRWKNHPLPVTLACVICSKPFTVRFARSKKAKCCSIVCKQTYCGRLGGAVTGEIAKQRSQGKAYTKIKGRHSHRVIAERKIGRALRSGEVVHHKDGNILNNNPENLEVLASQGEHMKRHRAEMLQARKEKHGY